MDVTYQIAWWDKKVQSPDRAGWKFMPSEIHKTKHRGIERLHSLRKLYPGITFSLQKISREILAQVQ